MINVVLIFLNFLKLNAAEVKLSIDGYSQLKAANISQSIEIITSQELKKLPGVSLDEKISNLVGDTNLSRPSGPYSYKSVVSLRGFSSSEQGRTLILLDGVPLNTYATGSVNWNMLSLEDIERVEVFKGAGSFLYGSNAVAGTINIVTVKPDSFYRIFQSYGSYDTFMTGGKAGFRTKRNSLSISAINFDSDGYIAVPNELKTAYTVKKYAKERDVSFRNVFNSETLGNFDLKYVYYNGIRGEGNRILTAKGSNREFINNFASMKWNFNSAILNWEAILYYQNENYLRLNEYYKGVTYTRVNSDVIREDWAFNASAVGNFYGTKNIFGFDFKKALVNGKDTQISPVLSRSYNRGDIYQYSLYYNVKKEYKKIELLGGLRYDRAVFYDGYYANEASGWSSINGPLDGNSWYSLSSKFYTLIKYDWGEQYFSYGRAFRPGVLEDMCLNLLRGTKFTEANPHLEPEKVDAIETGFKLNPLKNIYFDPSFYVNYGYDFIYEINTGRTVNINGIKPVYRKENIARVKIYGVELPLKYFYGKLAFNLNYAYSNSELLKYPPNKALEDKKLTYSPQTLLSSGVSYSFDKIDFNISWRYKSWQFTDDTNTQKLPSYSVYGVVFSYRLFKNGEMKLSCENIFDKKYIESSTGEYAPGRFFNLEVRVVF